MIKTHFSTLSIHGRFKLWNVDRPDVVITSHNLVTYQGADILAALLAGQADRRIAAIWFEYTNAGSPVPVTPSRADTSASVIAAATVPAQRDIMQGFLVAPPVQTPSDAAKYAGNQDTFYALSSGTPLVNGGSIPFGSGSSIIGLGLMVLPQSGPLIYARAAVNPVLAVSAGAQVAATWITEID